MNLLSLSDKCFFVDLYGISEIDIKIDDNKITLNRSDRADRKKTYTMRIVSDIIELYDGEIFIGDIRKHNSRQLLMREYFNNEICYQALIL